MNLAKSAFGQDSVTYLGHVVGHGEVRQLTRSPTCTYHSYYKQGASEVPWDARLLPAVQQQLFFTVLAPLTDLSSSIVPLRWIHACDMVFTHPKILLASFPVVRNPDFT